jgi:hypothetical protein
MTKLTYTVALDVAINAVSDEAVKEKLTALKAQIAKRNSGERKPSKTQVANESLKGEILDWLTACDKHQTATDVADHFGISNQKASALLTAMVGDKMVTREVVKRKAYFFVGESAQYLDREVAI